MTDKISIRCFDDRGVNAVWNDGYARWRFSVLGIVGALNGQAGYAKNRDYWKHLKVKLKREAIQLGSGANQLKLPAADGKKCLSGGVDSDGMIALEKNLPDSKAGRFIEWFIQGQESIDRKSMLNMKR